MVGEAVSVCVCIGVQRLELVEVTVVVSLTRQQSEHRPTYMDYLAPDNWLALIWFADIKFRF